MISVCIATHNGEKYIREQLDSILCQLSTEDEIVISDDGSTDATLEIIGNYKDSRIKVYTMVHTRKGMKSHYYVTKNFENALKFAKGDYIFLSDQDDIWIRNKVDICMEYLLNHDMVLHNLECVDGNLQPLNRNIYNNSFRYKNYLMRKGKHYGCALAFKRELLQYILPFPQKLVLHDFWIGIMGEIFGRFIFINQALTKYRIHSYNTSGSAHKNNSLYYKLSYRLYTIKHILLRYCIFN
ncbi:MAG: glycosyltransferase [Bacteroides sp.]|nr:glycosyltransferase [Bacteroides sp.]